MLKKNIAKTMAAATVLSAATPMANVVFADVVENTQAEEIKALKNDVYEKFNTKYTLDKGLLTKEGADKGAVNEVKGNELAGTAVYNVYMSKTGMAENADINDGSDVELGSENSKYVQINSYAEFEKAFDKAFEKLNNGEKIIVKYESKQGARVLEDKVTVVDSNKIKYPQVALPESEELDESFDAETSKDVKQIMINYLGKVTAGTKADGTKYSKLPISGGKYITVESGDEALDLTQPKFEVIDGYYVDADKNRIKKFDISKTIELDTIKELVALGGVVVGYYPQTDEETMEGKIDSTVAIVKKATAVEKVNLTVGDIYEASTGRYTKYGNELVKAIRAMIIDDSKGLATLVGHDSNNEDNTRAILTTINKAGEEVHKYTTEDLKDFGISRTSLETQVEDYVQDLTDELNKKEIVKVKITVETTKDETVTKPEWTPVYEATITEGRNEKFANIVPGLIGLNKMTIAAGMDRYESAVETSKLLNPVPGDAVGDAVTDVVLVSGASDKLVDGLTATPLAASLDAPILLTKANEVPAETLNEIKRLGAKNITIVGGESSVSDEVITLLTKTYGLNVTRLGGTSRYETSMAVANHMASEKAKNDQESAGYEQVFVVGGKGEADALSVAAIAGEKEAPILLTPAGELDKDVKHFINKNVSDDDKKTDVYIVGGTNSVSSKVQNQLVDISVVNQLDNNIEVKRLAGVGRQETNAAVIKEFASVLDGGVVVAKSDNKGMIDALSAGAFAANTGSHIVLATNELVDAQEDALKLANDGETLVEVKTQVGYGIGKSVIEFVNSIFKRVEL